MFIDLLRKRRSIRTFQDKPVEQVKIDLLIEAMLRSPSSRGLNPWGFVVVQNRETIEAMSRAKQHGSAFMKGPPWPSSPAPIPNVLTCGWKTAPLPHTSAPPGH